MGGRERRKGYSDRRRGGKCLQPLVDTQKKKRSAKAERTFISKKKIEKREVSRRGGEKKVSGPVEVRPGKKNDVRQAPCPGKGGPTKKSLWVGM